MPTIKYSNNPNSDTAFVVQDSGQKNRAVLTAEPAGTLQLSDSANVSTGYVTDEDGKKHKVNLVAQLEGDIEFSENPNSTKGYATVDGKKHRVVLTASLAGGGGSAPVIDELNVTPSTSAQVITAPSGTDGYSPVNVSAVTSSIDANITAGNIKKDVSILGVTGSYEGVAPSGTKNITTNGIHDVAGYANADVQVPTTAPASYRAFERRYDGALVGSTTTPWIPLPAGVTDISAECFAYAYQNSTAASGEIDLSTLTKISGANAFNNTFWSCKNTTGVDLSSLKEIIGNSACYGMFLNNTNLVSVKMSALENISGSQACSTMFSSCIYITSVDLSSLTNVTSSAWACQNMFSGCSALSSINLSSLKLINNSNQLQNMFQGTVLSVLSFPALTPSSFGTRTNQFNNMLLNVTGCTVHFPSNIQSKIGSWSDVTNGFGGTNTTVLFDLPSTAHLTGVDTVEYERNPKYDTATALSWRVNGTSVTTTPYYTSGTTDPVVGGTIYSDSACTTAVTTIASIA